jgi:hypothetical protein
MRPARPRARHGDAVNDSEPKIGELIELAQRTFSRSSFDGLRVAGDVRFSAKEIKPAKPDEAGKLTVLSMTWRYLDGFGELHGHIARPLGVSPNRRDNVIQDATALAQQAVMSITLRRAHLFGMRLPDAPRVPVLLAPGQTVPLNMMTVNAMRASVDRGSPTLELSFATAEARDNIMRAIESAAIGTEADIDRLKAELARHNATAGEVPYEATNKCPSCDFAVAVTGPDTPEGHEAADQEARRRVNEHATQAHDYPANSAPGGTSE